MNIKFLEWDSAFFGKKIGSIEWSDGMDTAIIETDAHKEKYDLIYIFAKTDGSQNLSITQWEKKYQTTNVTYQKQIRATPTEYSPNIRQANIDTDQANLMDLAFQAGHSSRFVTDKHFGHDAGQRLYHQWIQNSLQKVIAHEVLVFTKELIGGFVTLKLDDSYAEIGLIAVDASVRNQNIGSKLIQAAEKYTWDHSLKSIKVGTQKENIQACRFYEKNNFEPIVYTQIYHLWL